MRLFSFAARQNGKRQALDLVASELADLEQRSQIVAETQDRDTEPLVASGSWCAPGDYGGLLDLPLIGVKRRSIDELKMERRWS